MTSQVVKLQVTARHRPSLERILQFIIGVTASGSLLFELG